MQQKLMVIEGELVRYVQYENTDFLNGTVVRVPDGHRLMREVSSHHQCIMPGHTARELQILGDVFGLELQRV